MRMIDANKFRRFAHEQLENDKLYSADDILEMIDEQSTAYNVEAVAMELIKHNKKYCDDIGCVIHHCSFCYMKNFLNEQIDIVIKGGVK